MRPARCHRAHPPANAATAMQAETTSVPYTDSWLQGFDQIPDAANDEEASGQPENDRPEQAPSPSKHEIVTLKFMEGVSPFFHLTIGPQPQLDPTGVGLPLDRIDNHVDESANAKEEEQQQGQGHVEVGGFVPG